MAAHIADAGDAAVRRSADRVLLSSAAVFVMTSVHHAYGAYVYDTAWRYHAVVVSGIALCLIAVTLRFSRTRSGTAVGAISSLCFLIINALLFLGFGIFEGGYNHVLKDALYFTNVSPEIMHRLFPPEIYEMPNDALFEATGVLQVVPGVLIGYYLFRFGQERQQSTSPVTRRAGERLRV
jgi:hypothetical protein